MGLDHRPSGKPEVFWLFPEMATRQCPTPNAQCSTVISQKRSPGALPSQLLSEEVTNGEGFSFYPMPPMILGTWLLLLALKTFQEDASFVTISPR